MKLLSLFFITVIFLTTGFPQPSKGNVGISVSIQNTQFDFLIPIFFQDKVSVSPAIGINKISNNYTDLSLGAILRFYLSTDNVAPFLGMRAGALMFIPDNEDLITDFIFGPFFGGEYYFSKNFSVGIELQLNIIKSASNSIRFNNPNGTNINSATAFFATIYF
jgi:hypothetical protein